MSQESYGKTYYDSIKTSLNYIDMMSSIQACIWDYMAHVFFGGDLTRVLYTDAITAFRSRLLQLGDGIDEDEINQGKDKQFFIANAQFPFASFALTGAPQIIKDRSSSLMQGYYDESIHQYVHFWNEEQGAKVQIFFDRVDDMAIGYKLAQAESHSKAPMKYLENIGWRGKILPVPIFITVDKVVAGQDAFTNSEFLKTNGLFPVVLTLKIETASPHFNRGVNLVQLPYKWRISGRPDTWKDGDRIYYTRKTVLNFAPYYKNVKMEVPEEPSGALEDTATAFYRMENLDKETIKAVSEVFPNPRLCEMIKGTFSNASKIQFSRLKYNATKTEVDPETGRVKAWIDLRIHPNSFDFWNKCKIIIPGHPDGKIDNCKSTSAIIEGLYPNSNYTIYFVSEDINGNCETIPLTFTTPVWDKETDAVMDGTPESINNRVNDEPKDVPLNGLIDLDNEWTGYEL